LASSASMVSFAFFASLASTTLLTARQAVIHSNQCCTLQCCRFRLTCFCTFSAPEPDVSGDFANAPLAFEGLLKMS
jgi:hypothetical protein